MAIPMVMATRARRVVVHCGRILEIDVYEDNVPPRFRVTADTGIRRRPAISPSRPSGRMAAGNCSRSRTAADTCSRATRFRSRMPSWPGFAWRNRAGNRMRLEFEEHEHDAAHGAHHRDNNMRAAVIHVMADAAVSVLVIVGLVRRVRSAGSGWTRWPA